MPGFEWIKDDSSALNRMLSKIDRRGPDECWEWQAKSNNGKGYGRFRVGTRARNTLLYPHKVMWEMANGVPVPEGMEICHSCDNPPCCNPAHLFARTHGENMKEMATRHPDKYKNRVRSPSVGMETAREIRRLYAVGDTSQTKLARKYDVSQALIGQITRNEIYRENLDPAARAEFSSSDTLQGMN